MVCKWVVTLQPSYECFFLSGWNNLLILSFLSFDPNFYLDIQGTISAAEVGYHGKIFSPVKIDRSLAGGVLQFLREISQGIMANPCGSHWHPFFWREKIKAANVSLEVQPATMFVFIVIRSGNQWLIEMKLVACEAFCEALCSIESTDSDSDQ